MPLTRQIWLLLAGMLALALCGSVTLGTLSTRDLLQAQLQASDEHAAAALALALAPETGDAERMRRLAQQRLDGAVARRVRYIGADGSAVVLQQPAVHAPHAPDWFGALVPLEPAVGSAPVIALDDAVRPGEAGPRRLGTVEVSSSTAPLHDALWRGCVRLVAAHAALALAAGMLASLAVRRLRRPFDAVTGQALAIVDGRFVTVDEPRAPELRRLARAMNSMVTRLKAMSEAQASQLDQLRRQAQCDPLTGVSTRNHFLGELRSALQREDGPYEGGLVLLRVCGLAQINRLLGRAATDRMLCAVAQLLRPYGEGVKGCFTGRLNGADFALCMPVGGMALETAQALAGMLRNTLPAFGAGVSVALGAVELRRDMAPAAVLAAADAALARAESRGAYAVELAGEPPTFSASPAQAAAAEMAGWGESAWRERIEQAIEHGRFKLMTFPLIDAEHGLVHLECMLRLQLIEGGPFEPAARWLPHAARSGHTAALDEHAVALALRAIAADGEPRCVNLSPVSLGDSGYAARLRALLFAAPPAARKLWLEVAESAAVEQFALVRELGRQLRPCGVRWGLEHLGPRLGRIERLLEAGFDYVKLDASMVLGVASDMHRASFVRGSVDMLHGMSLRVYAEGVADTADARALWRCGIDGITGPWASILRADAVN